MTEPFYLGAYWGPRAESVASCAEKLAACLRHLQSGSPLLGIWYEKGRRLPDAKRRPVDTSPSNLKPLLTEGVNRRDASLGTARRLVEAVVGAWEPDWATLTSYGLHDAVDPGPRQPILGWITYLSAHRPVPPHVASGSVEPREDGTLVVAADSVDAVDASVLRRLAEDLEDAGSLVPMP